MSWTCRKSEKEKILYFSKGKYNYLNNLSFLYAQKYVFWRILCRTAAIWVSWMCCKSQEEVASVKRLGSAALQKCDCYIKVNFIIQVTLLKYISLKQLHPHYITAVYNNANNYCTLSCQRIELKAKFCSIRVKQRCPYYTSAEILKWKLLFSLLI